MKRPKFKREWRTPWRAFYVPSKKFVGAGLKDASGNLYIVRAGGNLERVVS